VKRHIDAILFDLDGTLVDSRKDLTKSVQYLQKKYGALRSTELQVASFIGDGVDKLVQRALPHVASKKRLEEAVAFFKTYYREHCLDHTRVYPTVKRVLEYFKDKPMAVVTNKPVRVSGRILQGLKLDHYFKFVVGGDSLPHKKPHPAPLYSALQTIGIKPTRRVVIVGDSRHDVIAGKAAGIRTCGIRSNIGDYQNMIKYRPDFIITRMSELVRLFK
jgi:phosphoglycolate phosphatase